MVLCGKLRQSFRLRVVGKVPEGILVGVRADESRHHRKQPELPNQLDHLRVVAVVLRDPPLGELVRERLDQLVLQFGVGLPGTGLLVGLVTPLFKRLEVGQHEFGQNHIKVADRIEPPVDVNHIRIFKKPHHMGNGVHSADVPQKLIAQPLPLAGALDQAGNVDELHRRRNDPPGVLQIGEDLQPLIRHRHDSGVGFDGTEGEVGGLRPPLAERVEQGGLADIRQSDETTGETHLEKIRN